MSYIADPNDNKKQIPAALPGSAFPNVTAPDKVTLVDRASKVFIHGDANDVHFTFTSGSFASTTYIDFSDIGGTNNTGVELNIQPVAWSGSSANGTVIFYQHGGL
jgi:hypothetical protein